ncbi:MAG: BamA/TamA family outer membrane protein [Melioribacteraceae bacterium]|nr:BamA/TamA family outer membrane protein [Melioribacteraceae bacterium]MCF8431859.1 BamA/TamA family outer membrane protein [Melioribacteraceae bacterium]
MTAQIIKYLPLLFIVSNLNCFSQSYSNYIINGNNSIIDDIYSTWLDDYFDKDDSSTSIEKFVFQKISAQGFLTPKIVIADSVISDTERSLILTINEGSPFTIQGITFPLKTENDSLIFKSANDEYTGKILSKINIEESILFVLDQYESIGFPFAIITIQNIISEFNPEEDIYSSEIILTVEKNIKGKIDSIKIAGNKKTSRNVILRTIDIKQGDLYNESKVNSVSQKLNKLRFFEPLRTPEYFITQRNKGILEITVEEISTNNFDGIVGYVPSTNEKIDGYFTGYLDFGFRNIFGTGRNFAFKWEKEDRSSQLLELKYLEPWIFSLPINVNVDFFQRQQDSTYVKRRIKTGFEFLATDEITASILFSSESVIPTFNENFQSNLYNSEILSAGINFTIDSRDDFYSPQKGLFFTNTYFYSSKKISSSGDRLERINQPNSNLQRVEVDLMFFQKVFAKQIAKIGLSWRETTGSFLELSDMYQLGGTNSLRGYRENQFLGNRIIWSNLEYRLLLSQRTFFSVFYDYGYYLLEKKVINISENDSQFLYGYGIGINVETGLGVLRVNYAIGENDQINEGKIHFGLINEF